MRGRSGRLVASASAAVLAGAMAMGPSTNAMAAGPSAEPDGNVGANALSDGGVTFAYYDQWSIYQNGFFPKFLHTRGIADKVDFLIYDFENIHPTNFTCFETTHGAAQGEAAEQNPDAGTGAGDQFADYEKAYSSANSVDGTTDSFDDPIRGNFKQLQELKELHPDLKILLSIGGWTYSKFFSDAAATPQRRATFASSCIDMFIEGNLPMSPGGFGGDGVIRGLFDGIDIDWEYPGSDGGHLGNHTSPADEQNFTALLSEFRSQLDAFGSANGRRMYLTAALPAGQDKIAHIETDKIGQFLDYANIMTFDYHGGFEPQGPTNFQDALFPSAADPMNPVAPGTKKYNTRTAIDAWLDGDAEYGIPGGFPAGKLNISFPLYYRGWTGVAAGDDHGLYAPASGPAPGAPLSGNIRGIRQYKELLGVVDNPSMTFFDPVTRSAYFYDGNNFWTGLSPQSIRARVDFLHCRGLAGAMMFSLYDMDPGTTLLNLIHDGLSSSPAECTVPDPGDPPGDPGDGGGGDPGDGDGGGDGGTPPGECAAPGWSATSVYVGGSQVSFDGHVWTAKWWTQGETPGTAEVWTDNGACDGAGGGGETPPAGSCPAAWSATSVYTGGQTVSFDGHVWTARWWTQGETPGTAEVWTDNGPCDG